MKIFLFIFYLVFYDPKRWESSDDDDSWLFIFLFLFYLFFNYHDDVTIILRMVVQKHFTITIYSASVSASNALTLL